MDLLEPKEILINSRKYIISKFPTIAGREILAKYPMSNLPKIGDYKISEEIMLKLMGYVAVEIGDGKLQTLTTSELINNHVKYTTDLIKLEKEMLAYNFDFFSKEQILNLLEGSAKSIVQFLIKTLMDSLPPSSPEKEQPTSS